MTLTRSARMSAPRKPLAQFSAKRLAELAAQGIDHPMSTFTPKTPKLAAPRSIKLPARPAAERSAPKRQAYTGPKRSVCAMVDIRSSKQCEFPGCEAPQDHRHHRLNRKAGGRKGEMRERLNSAAWLLGVCHIHHEIVTNPVGEMVATVERMGWVLREGQDATQVEVFTRHSVDPVWLDNAGTWAPYDEAAA